MAVTQQQTTPVLAPAVPAQARLHIVSGKGGTGKTTVAAALALAMARVGRRVLLVEVEGRQGIAQVFNIPPLTMDVRSLVKGHDRGEVLGMAVEPEEALIEYLEIFYNLKRSARLLKKIGAVDFATTVAPGIRDVLLTGKVKYSVGLTERDGHPAYDAVVLDAPPTGRIRQFLDATREVAALTKLGPINEQSKGVMDLLHGPRTAIHLVTLLEEMPVQETVDGATDLTASGYKIASVILNRSRRNLVPGHALSGEYDLDEMARGLQAANVDPSFAGPLAAELAAYAITHKQQDETQDRLNVLDVPRIELPELAPPVQLGELDELAGYFLGQPQ